MQPTLPKRSRLLEFCLLAALIAGFSVLLLRLLTNLQNDAERLAVELTIRNMNSGLALQQADRIMSGRESSLAELVMQNPVDWLKTPPDGYVGEGRCDDGLKAGQWAWHTAMKTLYFRPHQSNWLAGQEGVACLTWRVLSRQHQPLFRPGSHRLQPVVDGTIPAR